MRDRRMGCIGHVFLPLSQNTFLRFPLPCEWVGLAAKQLQVRRKEVDCLLCCASCQLSPSQEPALCVPASSGEDDVAGFHSFPTFAHLSFEIVNFQSYLLSYPKDYC